MLLSAHNVTWIPTRIQQIVLQLILLLKEVQTIVYSTVYLSCWRFSQRLTLTATTKDTIISRLTHMILHNSRFFDTVEGPEIKWLNGKSSGFKSLNIGSNPSWSYTFFLFVSLLLERFEEFKSAYSLSSRELLNIS